MDVSMPSAGVSTPSPSQPSQSGNSNPDPKVRNESQSDTIKDSDKTERKEGSEAKPKDEKPQKKKPPRYLKIDDEEISEDDLIRNYKKYKGSDQKFREAADMRKEAQRIMDSAKNFVKALETDPESVLEKLPSLSAKKRELAEKWLAAEIEKQINPPDPRDLKLKEYESKLSEYEQAKLAEREAEERQEKSKKIESRKRELSDTLAKAMEFTPLSKNPETAAATLREMAVYMRTLRAQGEDATPEEIAQHVENRKYKEFYSLANTLEGEDLVKFLGEDVVKKIRKFDLSRLERKTGNRQSFRSQETSKKPAQQNFIDPRDLKFQFRDKAR